MRRGEEEKERIQGRNVICSQEYPDIHKNYGTYMRPQSLSLVANRSVKSFVQNKINRIFFLKILCC